MEAKVAELLGRTYADQRSQEWLALRETMLTASDVASAIGHNRYERPDDLLRKKVLKTAWAGNAATAHGTLLEPVARDLYDERYGKKSHEIGLVQHPIYSFLGGSADGITEDGILLEIKCPLTRKIEDKVPKHYIPQIQLLLEIIDFENCDFVQYRPATVKYVVPFGPFTENGAPPDQVAVPVPEIFMVTRVTRDREWFAGFLPTMQRFWDGVIRARENGLCEVEHDAPFVPKCEVILDEISAEPRRMEVPAQAQVLDVPGMRGEFLCGVYSARDALLSRAA
jgi:putative phage-type endonuclease